MKPKTSIQGKSLQERAYEAVEAALGKNSPEGRYALGILGTKARHARNRLEVKIRRSISPGGAERADWKRVRDKADAEFSRFIRLRDTILHPGATVRVGRCVTCGNTKAWEHIQCGHWIRRRHWGTRWSEFNCHGQCDFCNDPKRGGGREPEHEEAIKILHGATAPDRLRAEQKLKARKPSLHQLEALVAHFKARADQLSFKGEL
jgi:hypothetical protein